MKKIKLANGKSTFVDNDMYLILSRYKWHSTGVGYVKRAEYVNGKQINHYMHRDIMDAPNGLYVDHINGNILDNRKINLRICDNSKNQMNAKSKTGSTSRFKGVCWHKQIGKWRASIKHLNRQNHIGLFDDEKEAALAYNTKAKELFGEFAYLNKV